MASEDPFSVMFTHKTEGYTYRVPTPPRIVVPPPGFAADGAPPVFLSAAGDTPHDFLRNVQVEQRNLSLEWTYERRREAQNVLPFLSLGPLNAARDENWLRREHVTLLLGVRQTLHSKIAHVVPRALADLAGRLGIEHHSLILSSNQDLIHAFPSATRVINQHLREVQRVNGGERLGKVLVFCESGNERSAAVVAAYLMEMFEDVDHVRAMQLCQAQRFCVNFDEELKRLLQGYWDILCAKRMVGTKGDTGTFDAVGSRTKRGRERDDADEGETQMTEEDVGDWERWEGRQFTPFVDQTT